MRKYITITSILLLMLSNLNAAVINNDITTDLVWTCGDSWQNSNDVIIEAGVTLTVNNCNTFTFPNNLILMDGAYLVINSSIITINTQKAIKLKKNSLIIADNSYFTGSFWQGFIFDNSVISGTDVPGAIKLTNSHVNNAIVVFQGYFGGNIYSSNCKFYDFSKFLHLANYSYQNTTMLDRCFF